MNRAWMLEYRIMNPKLMFLKDLMFESIPKKHITVIKEVDKGEYVIREEDIDQEPYGAPTGTPPLRMKSAYSKLDNGYIGEPKFAKHLVEKLGLSKIQKAGRYHSVCSIGFKEEENKWYYWDYKEIKYYDKKM